MKRIILASACVIALSTGGAFAQSQPTSGASSEGNVGPGASNMHQGTSDKAGMKKGMTTGQGGGMSKGMTGDTSSEGNVGPGTSNNNTKSSGAR